MTTIAFLACETTLPGAGDRRRGDAYEHDLTIAALKPAFAAEGLGLRVVDWEAPIGDFEGCEAALIGTAWNYQDKARGFLDRLDALEARGIAVLNPPSTVRWNIAKPYLRELAEAGIPNIPTMWLDEVTADDTSAAMERFACEKLVIKRQVGAGAEGQLLIARDAMPDAGWRFGRPAMVQPFLPAIAEEGELSFVFIDGEPSHALRKRPAQGDYRIQSLYGGRESAFDPAPSEIAAASAVLAALPVAPPVYARIDMLRDNDGALRLMEAELIEPYLYPEQGERVGEHLARALARRLAMKGP